MYIHWTNFPYTAQEKRYYISRYRNQITTLRRGSSSNHINLYFIRKLKDHKDLTCFRETGKVIFPENSGLLTISLHISLHVLQTAAHATTCFRAGHALSLASNLLITSRKSSGGRLAQRLFWITKDGSCNSWTELCDFPLWWPGSLTSKLRLDKLPSPSLTSRTILRNDIYSNALIAPDFNILSVWLNKYIPLMLKDDQWPQTLKFKYNCKSNSFIQIPITMLNNKERKEKRPQIGKST